jgi:hypothetical protein
LSTKPKGISIRIGVASGLGACSAVVAGSGAAVAAKAGVAEKVIAPITATVTIILETLFKNFKGASFYKIELLMIIVRDFKEKVNSKYFLEISTK